ISPTSGSVGTSVRVTGSNFGPSQRVSITFDNQLVATTNASSNGSFSTTFDVPGLAARSYQVRIGNIVRTFVIKSSFSITPSSGPPGTSVTVRGSGFSPGSSINITLDGRTQFTVNANNDGRILTDLDIPSNTAGGAKSIAATSSSLTGQASFNVTATLSLDRSEATIGDSINVSGAGFKAFESGISVKFDNKTLASGLSADSQGVWSASFDVPDATGGSHAIKASSPSTPEKDVRQTRLTVVAALRLNFSSGAPGTVVRVSGTGAGSRDRITIVVGEDLATVKVNANSQGVWTSSVTIPVAPGGLLNILARGTGGQAAEASFRVTPIIRVAQAKGFPGSRVELKGDGFLPNQGGIPISFGGSLVDSASADSSGSWLVEIIIPHAAAGSYPISVPGSTSALRVLFSVTAGLSLSTPVGAPGGTVTVVGSGFAGDEKDITLYLGNETVGTGIIANADGTWDIRFKIPSLPSGTYIVSAAGSITSSANIREQALVLGPLLTLNASSGTPGMTIEVRGAGFVANAEEIYFTYDGVVVAQGIGTDALGSFARSFVIPPSTSGNHLIAVTSSSRREDGNDTTEIRLLIKPEISLESSKGPPGSSVMISGAGFGANEQGISLTYDGNPVVSGISADSLGSFQSSFLVPLSGAGPHSIQANSPLSGAADTSGQGFTVSPSLELSEITGNIGLQIRIIGEGFEPGSTVILTYDDLTKATVTADDFGSIRLEFRIPESQKGEHVIMLIDDQQNDEQAFFAVENTPPVAPSLREPSDGSSGGFLGGFKPRTRWQDVEDPSGVRYTLQIATDPDFDDVILEKAGLERPRYTLADEEKLPRGNYFWRVRATDRASNESGWSNAYELQSGTMPIWLLSVLALIGFLTSGGGVYAFYQGRKRAKQDALTDLVQLLPPRVTPALGAPPSVPSLAAPSRRALTSPFRGARALSIEEEARLEHVVVFLGSIPLLEVSSHLDWLEEMIETIGGIKEDIHEQLLQGELDLIYQPDWLQHPTYNGLRQIPQLLPFLRSLEEYVWTINECARDTMSLLQAIADDLSTAPPLETSNGNRWRFILTVGLGSLTWFWGTHLANPSSRDYVIDSGQDSEADDPNELSQVSLNPVSLSGEESSPFGGLILEGLTEDDATFFRDLHIQLRVNYRADEAAQALAAKLASTDLMRHQIMERTAQLGQLSQRR
ncbi:MAG: hypothetical protein IH870_03655, partial [Chloroflexi bacterium]|nr:hypothetical protein [Chloroflexota bacterium]